MMANTAAQDPSMQPMRNPGAHPQAQTSFTFMSELSDEQISRRIDYCLSRGWALSIEYQHDPHPRDPLWERFGRALLETRDPAAVMGELYACRRNFPRHYIKVNAFDLARGADSPRLSFIAGRPEHAAAF